MAGIDGPEGRGYDGVYEEFDSRLARQLRGDVQLVAPGCNERVLEVAGLRLLRGEDRTSSLLKNAAGRLAARLTHRVELEERETAPEFERQQRYLETVIALSRSRAVERRMYLAA